MLSRKNPTSWHPTNFHLQPPSEASDDFPCENSRWRMVLFKPGALKRGLRILQLQRPERRAEVLGRASSDMIFRDESLGFVVSIQNFIFLKSLPRIGNDPFLTYIFSTNKSTFKRHALCNFRHLLRFLK